MRLVQLKLSLAVVAALTGMASRASAYRTAADLPAIGSPTPVRWAGQSFGYVVTKRAPSGLSFAAYRQALDQALATWTQVDCGSLVVRDNGAVDTSAEPGDGQNTVEWIPSGWVERGFDPSVPGQTDVMYEQDATGRWVIREADIYLNGEQNTWDLAGESNSSAWSVRSVVLHEGGHAVGILHPCEITAEEDVPACSTSPAFDAVAMNPVYSPTLAALSEDDIAGICSIYPKGLCIDRVCLETETCTGAGCRLTCGSGTCDEGKLCDNGSCVDPEGIAKPIDGAAKDAACRLKSDCQRGLSCIAGTCQGGGRKLGDLCEEDAECQDGVCAAAGYCAEACQTTGNCSEVNSSCEEMVGGVGACIGIARPLGNSCDSADDCVGKECLVDGESAPVCTRACDAAKSPCPSGWDCADVENRNVCVTATVDGGCGCRLGQTPRQTSWTWVLSILTVTTMILRRGQRGSRRVA